MNSQLLEQPILVEDEQKNKIQENNPFRELEDEVLLDILNTPETNSSLIQNKLLAIEVLYDRFILSSIQKNKLLEFYEEEIETTLNNIDFSNSLNNIDFSNLNRVTLMFDEVKLITSLVKELELNMLKLEIQQENLLAQYNQYNQSESILIDPILEQNNQQNFRENQELKNDKSFFEKNKYLIIAIAIVLAILISILIPYILGEFDYRDKSDAAPNTNVVNNMANANENSQEFSSSQSSETPTQDQSSETSEEINPQGNQEQASQEGQELQNEEQNQQYPTQENQDINLQDNTQNENSQDVNQQNNDNNNSQEQVLESTTVVEENQTDPVVQEEVVLSSTENADTGLNTTQQNQEQSDNQDSSSLDLTNVSEISDPNSLLNPDEGSNAGAANIVINTNLGQIIVK